MNLLDIIFPKNCLECRKPGRYMCLKCVNKVRFPTLTCPECKQPSINGFTHIKCQKKWGVSGILSLWKYEGIIRKGIVALKYKYATQIVNELINYIVAELQTRKFILERSIALIPIPLHWYREHDRGFNQSEILGKEVAKAMGWQFIPNLLLRKRWVANQVGLKRGERIKNMKEVFATNPTYHVQNTTYIIFDDVYTTGSTLKEAAKVLKGAGASKVWGLTVAR